MEIESAVSFIFMALSVITVFLVLFVCHLFFRPDSNIVENAFPKEKPTKQDFFSKDPEVSTRLTVYYSVKLLLWCVYAWIFLIALKKFNFI